MKPQQWWEAGGLRTAQIVRRTSRLASVRKAGLYAVAVSRLLGPDLHTDPEEMELLRESQEWAEQRADGMVALPPKYDGWIAYKDTWRAMRCASGIINISLPFEAERGELWREVIGDPNKQFVWTDALAPKGPSHRDFNSADLRPHVVLRRNWLTGDVMRLANAAYDCRRGDFTIDPERLAVLADALEEQGCDVADTLMHLRGRGPCRRCGGRGEVFYMEKDCDVQGYRTCFDCGGSGHAELPGPHVRGCWGLDLILEKS